MLVPYLAAAIAVVLVLVDWPMLKGKNMRRELVFSAMFWCAGLTSTCLALYHIKIPSPLLILKVVYEPVNKLFGMWFH